MSTDEELNLPELPDLSTDPAGGRGETGDDDPGLVDRAAAAFTAYLGGDRQQMGRLVDLLTPLLWHAARGQGLAGPTAEDVVQTAWLRLVDHAERIDSPRAVTAWLLTTVRREAWRASRRTGREDFSDPEREGDRPDPTPRPDETVVVGEQHRVLWRHVTALSPRCQHLLRVIAFADRPDYATVAQTLGMPVGSIGPTRGRCLASLREALAQDPSWEGGRP